MGVSRLAVEFIRAGLKGVVVIDRTKWSDPAETEDRPSLGRAIRNAGADEAA
jgi:hypothetical protein